ncbi:MAG: phosphatidate cytidylyltransferase [Bacteroidales bacterium]|nr:phosphatidate cytidylyltransferase [Bacteroidales bacterium]
MNNFISRTLSGIVFVVLILGSLLISPLVFALLMLVVNLLGVAEIIRLTAGPKPNKALLRTGQLLSVLFYSLIACVALDYLPFITLLPAVGIMLLPFVFALFSKTNSFGQTAATLWSSMLLVALPSATLTLFFNESLFGEKAGPILVFILLIMIWINDIFAYLFGIWLGKHRLFERISPKKSWEGSIGGIFMTLMLTTAFYYLTQFMPLLVLLGMALLVVVTAVIGDLIESMLKRQAGVKDSGTLIPGHGGILDRFDATFFAAPFVFIYLLIILSV